MRRILKLTLVLPAAFVVLSTSAAGTLWTSTPPGSWNCTNSGNACVAHTGFNPNREYWGQFANPRGNCTNYAAYRLEKNGARKPAGLSGGAAAWARKVRTALGSRAVNSTPAVGAIAWWSYGHVAYVEKIVNGAVYMSDSSFPLRPGIGGSERYVVRPGERKWPNAFLHIKDKPKPKPKKAVSPDPEPELEPEPEESGDPSDTSPPTEPTSPMASASSASTITLSWGKARDDVGVAGYSLYRSGTRVANTGSTSFKFTGLSCGTSYKLGVAAYDAAGNRSGTASITAATSPCAKSVTVSKGAQVNVSGCRSSACAYVSVKLSNFGGGSHTVTCYADYPPPTGSYYQYTTSSTTSNVCVYGYGGTHVWVKVDGVESNHLTW